LKIRIELVGEEGGERKKEKKEERNKYSVFTKDTFDEKGQARDTRVHVTL